MKTKSANLLPKTLPGTVCAQMIRCGKPNCKCARGDLHGPYFYHFTRQGGLLVKRYVRASDATRMRVACQARRKEEKRRRASTHASRRDLAALLDCLREYASIIEGLKE